MPKLRVVVVLGALAMAALACDDGGPRVGADPTPSVVDPGAPSATRAAAECPNQDDAVSEEGARSGGKLQGDVDGDGTDEDIFVVVDRGGPRGCGAFVVAGSGPEALAAPAWEAGEESGLPAPRIVALVEVDGEPGIEIVVSERAGASTEFAGLYTFHEGALTKVAVEADAEEGFADDLFAYGGSVGHIEGVGCEGPGTVIASFAVPGSEQGDLEDGIYEVERRLFVFEGSTLIDAGIQQERVPIDELGQFPEFSAGPFGTCGGNG